MKLARNKSANNKAAKKTTAKAKNKVVKKKKQSFDFKAFSNSLNALNKDNYGSAPLPVRIFLVLALVVALCIAAWFALINAKIQDIELAKGDQQALLDEYRTKERKARYLDEYKAQIGEMEVEFDKLLDQLPKDTRVSELIEGINMVGSGSGIRFRDISAEDEIEQEFFIEQPIKITAIGEYHQFGNLATGIAALPRIITMHDFELKNQQPSLDVMPQLQLELQTKTYRSKVRTAADEEAEAAATEGAQ